MEGKKRRITRKEYRRLVNEIQLEGLMAQKGSRNLAREKGLQDRGAFPRENGDVFREYNAMHEDNFLSSWLREDLEGKEERRKKVIERVREGERKTVTREEEREREGEKEENDTVSAKRRCVGFVSARSL